jgi:DnaJ-class molecular chaperone
VRCLECNGDGEVEREYTVGGYDGGAWMEYRVKWVECETCNGTGEIEDEQD